MGCFPSMCGAKILRRCSAREACRTVAEGRAYRSSFVRRGSCYDGAIKKSASSSWPTGKDMEGDRRTAPLRSGTLGILGFTLAYLLLALIGTLWIGNQEFLLYIAVMVPIVAVVSTAHLRVNFSTGVLWGLSIWGLAHMAGGLLPVPESWPIWGQTRVLYSWWLIPGHLKYDHLVHAFGFGVTTWLCWEALRSIVAGSTGRPVATVRPTLGILTLSGAAAMGFGALNEVVEFEAMMLVPETNVGGYLNTGLDLICNLVGAVVATGLIRLTARQSAAGVK